MAKIQGIRLLSAIVNGTTSGAQMQTLLADSTRLAAFTALLSDMPVQCTRMAASSTAMAAVASSSTAMAAVAASRTARAAVIASSTAMAAINANDQAVRIWMLNGTGLSYTNYANVAAVAASSTAMAAVAASSTAMTAVIASSTAMAAVAASKTALLACWNSETALTALRGSSTAVSALIASPFKSSLGSNAPSGLQSTMLAGKTILVRSYNGSGSDTNYLRNKYANGGLVGDVTISSTTSYTTNMVAFTDIRHYNWANNYTWYGDVVKVD